jgi:uncharacterized protein
MRRLALAALCVIATASAVLADLAIPPPPDRRINDYARALSPADRDRLEQMLARAEAKSGNQIVVAIFPSLGGESLEDYSIRLAEAWRVGQKGLDNGAIFLVFVGDRKMRIEVGYGLEGVLTDAVSAAILANEVAPRFRDGRMADGIAAGLEAIQAAIAGTYRPPARPAEGGGLDPLTIFLLTFVGVVVVAIIISALNESARARNQGWTGGPRGWGRRTRNGGWYGGWPGAGFPSGGSGGGGYGGGGGGGFSGGGGQFGGGGASGSW